MKKILSLSLAIAAISIFFTSPAQTFAQSNAYEDYFVGSGTASWYLEVFNDFQCPYCARFHRVLSSPHIRKYVNNGWLKITYRDFPLSFHAHATEASQAANAVLSIDRGKYRRMIDLIFRQQARWSTSEDAYAIFLGYAKKLGIDETEFSEAFHDPANLVEIKEDLADGEAAGVSGTPSYFINDFPFSGAVNLRTLLEQIEATQQYGD